MPNYAAGRSALAKKLGRQQRRSSHQPAQLAGRFGRRNVGGLIVADAARAQSHDAHGAAQGIDRATIASHATHSSNLSNRIYSVNPVHPEMADIAENPVNIPPPITRREPTTVRFDLETIEVEAHLDEKARFRF